MRISRTILALIFTALAVVLKYFGIDVDLGDPSEIPEAGWTLMEVVAWILGLLAAFFRTRAIQKTNNLGIKTTDNLTG